jgi:hypothetical protein
MPRQTLEQRAQWIYRVASLVATVEAFFLFIFGLDLTLDQILRFVLFGFPAPVVMYALDRRLIRHHVRPIQTALHALGSGEPTNPTCITQGWTQALNLPSLTLLRVLTVHAPSVLLPLTGLLLVANQVAGLGLMWWQFVILWLFWPITAVPHAILEYFLIARMTRAILAHLAPAVRIEPSMLQPGATMREIVRMVLGMSLPQPRIIRTATGVQLAWLFTFVSLMPMAVLGTSVYLKIMVREVTTAGQHLQDLAQLVAATPTALPGQDQRWWHFDASGSPVGNIPPPELSFAVLTTLAVRLAGWQPGKTCWVTRMIAAVAWWSGHSQRTPPGQPER